MESRTRLGPYEIQEQLGAGGMGEVYLAHDSRLDRRVAVKVLPKELAADPERLARLQQEARVLASLEHPNIATVYGMEESEGVNFLVMQLAQGETLADLIAGDAVPPDDFREIAVQLARGLEAAHEAGVIHRDLKPANLMVAPGGELKILDFGLAKALRTGGSDSQPDMTASPTMMAVTSAGMILGTASYMSPEQARGKPLDRRTDIWSFGVVLYEMLTGAKAFEGETVTDVMAAIVTRDPDWSRLPGSTPDDVRSLLQRCLEKDPRQRLRDIGEARVALESKPRDEPAVATPPMAANVARDRRGWMAALVMAALTVVLGWQAWVAGTAAPSSAQPLYVSLVESGIRQIPDFEEAQVAVSPDGGSIAIAGSDSEGPGIWVRQLGQPRARRLPGARGHGPTWSPDGQQLAFRDDDALRVHDLRTEATSVVYVGEGQLNEPTWARDGRLIVVDDLAGVGNAVHVNHPDGPQALTALVGEGFAGQTLRVYALDGGRFLASRWTPAHGHVDTAIHDPDGTVGESILHLDSVVVWVPPDLLFFARDGALWVQRLDLTSGQLMGSAVALVAEIDTAPGITPSLSIGGDTVSYRTGMGYEAPTVLEWVDREGQFIETLGPSSNYYDPRISPDGRSVVFDESNSGDSGDIWLAPAVGRRSRLTSHVADETRPVWSPDGTQVVLETVRDGEDSNLFVRDIAAPGEALRPIGTDPRVQEPVDWVGNTIIANSIDEATIWVVDATTGAARPFRETSFADYGGALAPDQSHIVYVSNETGRDEIWVDTFPEPGSARRLSLSGGVTPVWRRDGAEILYLDPDGFITAVEVRSVSPLSLGEPTRLFQISLRRHEIRQFDVTADGNRLLVNRLVQLPELPIRLLIGWRQELLNRAGPDW